MNKLIVRFVALALVFCLIPCTPAFAMEWSDNKVASEIQDEVDRLVDSRLNEVSHLFEGKEPGYLEAYTNYLYDLYEMTVMEQYGVSQRHARHRLDNGGAAKYTTVDAAGDYFDVVIIMLDKEDSYDYLLENWSPGSYDVGDVLVSVLGYVPYLGEAFGIMYSIIDGVSGLCGGSEWRSIQNADGYVMIETVVARGYPGAGVSMLSGWEDHPYYVPYSSLPSNLVITVEEFPA